MNNVLDPRDEVRKLQDLVRQLELQNAQLRSKQQARRKEQSPPLKSTGSRRRNSLTTDKNENIAATNNKFSLEDVDVIDVDALDLSDEGSWLFSSPKTLSSEAKSISPYQWMRRDVEDPENVELQTVKRALVNKLDEIARARFSGLEQLRSPVLSEPEKEKSPVYKPTPTGRKIDTRTFTRQRKHREEFSPRVPAIFDSERVEPSARVPTDADTPEDDCGSTASDSSMSTSTLHHLADVVDVQALARLQEESLQENLPPVSSPRRNSASGFPQASNVPVNNLENLYRQINENDPGKPNFSCSKSDSLDDSLSSDVSENLQTCESFDEDSTYSSSHRSSLPNVGRQNGIPMRNAGNLNTALLHRPESRLANPQVMGKPQTSRTSDGNRNKDVIHDASIGRDSRLSFQNARRESQNSLTSTVSSRSNSPSSRSAIPQLRRSGSPADVSPRSNLPKPMQSRIPAPRSRSNLPTRSSVSQSYSVDESWKEGCF